MFQGGGDQSKFFSGGGGGGWGVLGGIHSGFWVLIVPHARKTTFGSAEWMNEWLDESKGPQMHSESMENCFD